MRVDQSFIPVEGVGERTECRLWQQGITHWDEFDRDAVGPTTADRIQSFVDEARDRLGAGDAEYFGRQFPTGAQWRLYETFAETACFFDIETTGLDQRHDVVTTVSVRQGGDTTTLVRDRDLTAERLRAVFADADLLVSFNGKRFDGPFLRQSFPLEGVLERPHLDLLYPCRQVDLTGGLKQIETDVGIERDRPDLSGKDAVRLWYEAERGDDAALETLIGYNREDVVHLETVADRVTTRLHDRAVPEGSDL